MMSLKSFFSVHAVIALLFGLGFLLAPTQLASLYGGQLTQAGAYIGRLFGSALLTFAVILWLARESSDSAARRAMVLGFFITLIVGTIVTLHGQISSAVNDLGWSTFAVYALLTLGYGYFAMKQRQAGGSGA